MPTGAIERNKDLMQAFQLSAQYLSANTDLLKGKDFFDATVEESTLKDLLDKILANKAIPEGSDAQQLFALLGYVFDRLTNDKLIIPDDLAEKFINTALGVELIEDVSELASKVDDFVEEAAAADDQERKALIKANNAAVDALKAAQKLEVSALRAIPAAERQESLKDQSARHKQAIKDLEAKNKADLATLKAKQALAHQAQKQVGRRNFVLRAASAVFRALPFIGKKSKDLSDMPDEMNPFIALVEGLSVTPPENGRTLEDNALADMLYAYAHLAYRAIAKEGKKSDRTEMAQAIAAKFAPKLLCLMGKFGLEQNGIDAVKYFADAVKRDFFSDAIEFTASANSTNTLSNRIRTLRTNRANQLAHTGFAMPAVLSFLAGLLVRSGQLAHLGGTFLARSALVGASWAATGGIVAATFVASYLAQMIRNSFKLKSYNEYTKKDANGLTNITDGQQNAFNAGASSSYLAAFKYCGFRHPKAYYAGAHAKQAHDDGLIEKVSKRTKAKAG